MKLDRLIGEALETKRWSSAMQRLIDQAIGSGAVSRVLWGPARPRDVKGMAKYSTRDRSITIATGAPMPWALYATAHEVGHAIDIQDEQRAERARQLTALANQSRPQMTPEQVQELYEFEERAWAQAARILRKIKAPVDARFEARRRVSLKSYASLLRKPVGESKIARGVVPAYGNARLGDVGHGDGSQVAQGNIGGPRNRGVPGYPVPREMSNRRDAGASGDPGLETQDEARSLSVDPGVRQSAGAQRVAFKNRKTGQIIPGRGTGLLHADDPAVADIVDDYDNWEHGFLDRDGKYISPHDLETYHDFMLQNQREIKEGADPAAFPKAIPHLDDLDPKDFLEFLRTYADEPLRLELSEKVDGSARISFGPGGGHIWTQSKNGSRKALSGQYPDNGMYRAIRHAHRALENSADHILKYWPEQVAFMVAEVLYTRIPNSIEYGPNVIMIHGVHGKDGRPVTEGDEKALAGQVLAACDGKLSDGEEEWKFEYKRTIDPKDFQVDVRKEYDTLGQLYKDLAQRPRDKELKAQFKKTQGAVKEKLLKMLRSQRSAYGPEGGDVEGVVFRDTQTGALTKLVDKDYFTQLNQFLWYYRQLIERGAMHKGAWKKGVMQGFREVVAAQVLGDRGAAAPQFLKGLLQRYGPAGKAGGGPPEQAADQILAAYIKDRHLMSGKFALDFHRSLMGAFEDLENLRTEWEAFKANPQGIEIGGKKRTFPPEIVARTDEAFAEAQRALDGIKSVMVEVEKIPGDDGKRLAFLKIFLGHKYEKLVAALGGGEIAEARWPKALAAVAGIAAAQPSHELAPAPTAAPPTWSGSTARFPTAKDVEGRFPVDIRKEVKRAAKRHHVPEQLLLAVMHVESRGDPMAVSRKGAQGLMQLMPATQTMVGVRDPHDPAQSIDGGARYLRYLIKLFDGDIDLALAAWNFGPANVQQEKDLPAETQAFIAKVKDKFQELGGDPTQISEGIFAKTEKAPTREAQLYGDQLIDQFRSKLQRRLNSSIGAFIGAGTRGAVYGLQGGRVLKITADNDDARAAMLMRNKQLLHVYRVDDVFRFPGSRLFYGIVGERAYPLSQDERDLIKHTCWVLNAARGRSWEELKQDLLSPKTMAFYQERYQLGEEKTKWAIKVNETLGLGEMIDELNRVGYSSRDFHVNNIMKRRDGTLILIDLGHSISGGGEPPLLEGGPIDRMTGPTDLSGVPIKPDDPEETIESLVHEAVVERLAEAGETQQGTIGVTIGRFQPFHAGHAAVIRDLARRFTSVLVFVAGQTRNKKNPFSHELRMRMMELSLPDVWAKVKVMPAAIQGKGTGYIPGLLANAAASNVVTVPQGGSVTVLVGRDRLPAAQKQAQHNSEHQGQAGYYTGMIDVQGLPDVQSDDDMGRISGTRLREAIASGDKEVVKKLLDSHLSGGPDFEDVFKQLQDEMRPFAKLDKIAEAILQEMTPGMDNGIGFSRGGGWGSSGWSRAILAKDDTGDEMYQQLRHSPTTRMLPLDNPGTPNDHLPGQDAVDQRDEDEQDLSKPTDLGEEIVKAIRRKKQK